VAVDKFVTVQQTDFWEKVYIAAVHSGQPTAHAETVADMALSRRQERMSYELAELEKLHSEDEVWKD